MSRMRRIWTVAAVAIGAAALGVVPAALPAGAGQGGTLIVRKVVDGTATGGFRVVVECSGGGDVNQATLEFDASGTPTTFTGDGSWVSAEGAWQLPFGVPAEATTCTATETVADGATSTSWTCALEAVVGNDNPPAGCDAAAGEGQGPVGFSLYYETNEVVTQTATVTFTNTIAPEPVVLAPAFTG